MDNHYTVYVHISPKGLRYYGITGGNVKRRWNNGRGYITNQYFYRAIQKYGWDSFQHEIVAENLTKHDACEMEEKLIAEYHTQDPNCGYNLSAGGECNKLSQITKDKISVANKGKIRSDEVKKNLSLAHTGHSTSLKGCKLSDEHKRKISQSLKGRKHPHKVTAGKPVICDNMKYDKVSDCARFYDIPFGVMCAWLRGEKSMPYRFFLMNLSYVGVDAQYIGKLEGNVKAVKYDGKYFDSVNECAKYIGVDAHTISKWISGKMKMPEYARQKGLQYIPRMYYIVKK